MVVEGTAGIGKTALVRRAVAPGPDGMRVCWASADATERDLPYGVLEQLLRRLPPDVAGTRDLIAALGPRAAPLSIGVNLLSVLAGVSDQTPLAVVIDDLPQADDESVQALAFTLRRLWSEGILIIVTARTGGLGRSQEAVSSTNFRVDAGAEASGQWRRLWRGAENVLPLTLAGLDDDETTSLAETTGITGLNQAALERLQQYTGGNPLHLKTLLSEFPPSALADTSEPLPVPSTLQSVIQQAVRNLPDDARRLLDALAVLNTTTNLITAGQVAQVDDPTVAIGPLLSAGLISWDPYQPLTALRVHHSLQRDAIYQAIAPTRRAALHGAAADLVSPDAAWAHRVAAATSANPQLIAQLEAEANRHAARGNHERAATLLLWAADLSPNRQGQEHHLLNASTHLLLGRKEPQAQALRSRVELCEPGPRRDAVLGCLATIRGDFAAAEHFLGPAAARATDPVTRSLAATGLAVIHLLRFDGPPAVEILRPLVSMVPPGPAAHRVWGLLAYGASYTAGPKAGLEVLAEYGLPDKACHVPRADSPLLFYRGGLRVMTGQLASATDDFATLYGHQCADSSVPVEGAEKYLLGFAHYLTGRWDDALICADQALFVAETEDQPWGLPFGHVVAAFVHSHRGGWSQADAHVEACRYGSTLFPEVVSIFSMLAQATLAQARNDHAKMLSVLSTLNEPDKVAPGQQTLYSVLWAPLLLQAATESAPSRDLHQAEDALALLDDLALEAPALATTTHWLHARLAAISGNNDEALARYRSALDTPAAPGDDIPLNRAFCHADLARHLLVADRPRHTIEAGHHLEQAIKGFTALGAAPHAQRATDELGDLRPESTSRAKSTRIERSPGGPDIISQLTDRERSIAHLARQGLTNTEIGRQLLLSPKTIEYHLSHVYTKLDLTSRRQLRTIFPDPAGPA